MYKKALLATDGSTESYAAASVAGEYLDKGITEKLIIINVAANFEDSGLGTLADPETMNNMALRYGQQIVEATRGKFPDSANIATEVILGDPAMGICDYAKDEGCDLIIMGSRGKNPLSGLFLGSVSTRVLHFASCPVLIVKK